MSSNARQSRKWHGAAHAMLIAGLLPAIAFAADAPAPGPKKLI